MPALEDVQSAIDQWFQDKIRCGAIGQYTPAYNQAYAALVDLHADIASLFAQPVGDNAAPAPVIAPPVIPPVAAPSVSG